MRPEWDEDVAGAQRTRIDGNRGEIHGQGKRDERCDRGSALRQDLLVAGAGGALPGEIPRQVFDGRAPIGSLVTRCGVMRDRLRCGGPAEHQADRPLRSDQERGEERKEKSRRIHRSRRRLSRWLA